MKKKDVLINFLPPYSPELNLVEILWRRIKYQWLGFDANKSFINLKEHLNFILNNFGTKYNIKFYPLSKYFCRRSKSLKGFRISER